MPKVETFLRDAVVVTGTTNQVWLEHATKLEVHTGREVTDKFVIDITWETKAVKVTLIADISMQQKL